MGEAQVARSNLTSEEERSDDARSKLRRVTCDSATNYGQSLGGGFGPVNGKRSPYREARRILI